ncbi:unnamed protein product, partial [Ostreobium quekettii]
EFRDPTYLSVPGLGRFDVNFVAKFGSFEGRVDIPEDARSKDYDVYLRISGASPYLGSFTVGDPRLPTAGLTINAPEWALPTANVTVQVVARSLIGPAVGGATMKLDWRIEGHDGKEELASQEEITTNSTGVATVVINLANLAETPSLRSSLAIDVQWVGPTRELIEESSSVKLRLANIKVTHIRSLETDVPGVGFGVATDVKDLQGSKVDKAVAINLVDVQKDLERAWEAQSAGPGRLSAVATAPLEGEV